jgi:hypothetical protein
MARELDRKVKDISGKFLGGTLHADGGAGDHLFRRLEKKHLAAVSPH